NTLKSKMEKYKIDPSRYEAAS
ncbi:MAG: hypothetical protein RL263_636, partial [Bacteroidota bacterium]